MTTLLVNGKTSGRSATKTMIGLSRISWPIYQLNASVEFMTYNGLQLARNGDGSPWMLLDAPEIPNGSLGMRRLLYTSAPSIENYKLYKLRVPIYRYSDIFQVINRSSTFIDSSGLIFHYTRTTFYPLEYFKIKSVDECQDGYLISIYEVHTKFYAFTPPEPEMKYAGLLLVGKGYVLLEYSETKKKATRRKV